MAGIYFHIPFCKQACHYCNFHFSTSLRYKEEMVRAMLCELEARQSYLPDESLSSIYFGGGTPSLLAESDLMAFFEAIDRHFRLSPNAEITLEANPDDLQPEKLAALRRSPVNRLSIGIQSFSEEDLRFFNRAHDEREARRCLSLARDAGFEDLTIDLIYGSPTTHHTQWADNLAIAFEHEVPHLSCYALTVEPRTALDHFIKKGKAPAVDEEQAARQFDYLINATQAAGYEQYEISNFALPGRYAVHNSNYWTGVPYLGIGPSAHSFDGESRQWNVANNAKYLKAVRSGHPLDEAEGLLYEREALSAEDRYNEYVMTGLRTKWGVRLDKISRFGPAFQKHFLRYAAPLIAAGKLERQGDTFFLPPGSRFMADGIAAELFW
ncbi:MAG TPA: radical SAM family heme chaperone HemW [Phaeodactylibacter sp.]|nr:radical SAM family heme chaperone HemW [Phaeodactylibacter sp.]